MTTPNQVLAPSPVGVYEETIAGRFRHVTPTQLVMAWWSYQEGHLSRLDLRVWFALHEVAERRWVCSKDEEPRYRIAEIRQLVGGGGGGGKDPEKLLRAALVHLENLGLASWDPHAIRFATSPDQLAATDLDNLYEMLRSIPVLRRKIPVPRRLVRALAAGFGKGATATILGHLLTTLYAHRERGSYRVDGRCKASWIATTFGVSERAVRDARTRLVELGWLEILDAPQWQLNKWGAHTRIHVGWTLAKDGRDGKERRQPGGKSAPPKLRSVRKSAPPCLKPDALPDRKRKKNQTPAPARRPGPKPSGVSISARKKKSGGNRPPSVVNIQPHDLESFERTTGLYRDASARSLIEDSEHGEFQFFCLVERARARAHDPCRMLAWLLREKRFDYITQADEDAALDRIKRYGKWAEPDKPRSGPLEVHEPSADCRKYIAVLQVVERSRSSLSPLEVAKEHLGWTDRRWELAETEYLAWQHEKAIAAGAGAEA